MTITMTLRLNEDIHGRLNKLATVTDRSKAYLATQALTSFLDNNEWQVQAIQQALDGADQGNGVDFVDHGEVSAWLSTWGSDNEGEAPL